MALGGSREPLVGELAASLPVARSHVAVDALGPAGRVEPQTSFVSFVSSLVR
jgi:hypothetical protein